MAWYTTGTIALTNGSTQVDGTSTSWLGVVNIGDGFVGPDGKLYEVADVVSNVRLTLGKPYTGTSASGQAYSIFPTQGLVRSLTNSVIALITSVNSYISGVLAGRFSAGTASAPGVANATDTDTGIYWPTANTLGFAAAGAEVMRCVGGKVGIGSGSPGTKLTVSDGNDVDRVGLDVNGAVSTIYMGATTAGSAEMRAVFDRTSGEFTIARANNGGSATTCLRIDGDDGSVILGTQTAASALANGQMEFVRTSNTAILVRMKGSDGTVRTATLTLS